MISARPDPSFERGKEMLIQNNTENYYPEKIINLIKREFKLRSSL